MHPLEPPRVALAQLPTPVVELDNLAGELGLRQLLVKRDDLTELEVSGNKIRKLEYVVAEARAQGADLLVTNGGFQSNHCRATAAVGARLGMPVQLILRSPDPDPPLDGNLFLDHLFGAKISYHAPDEYSTTMDQLVSTAMDKARSVGRTPYFFPVGASVPHGCWGYIRCVFELVEQLGRNTEVDIYCATSSGGTQVGLMLGRALAGCENWRVLGIPVSDSVEYFQEHLRQLERQTVEQFQLGLSNTDTPINLVEGFIGEGYAVPYPEAVETIRLLGRTEGLVLDPSYTSKAMTGMLAVLAGKANAEAHRPDALPVFIHTGGAFGLFARRDLVASPA